MKCDNARQNYEKVSKAYKAINSCHEIDFNSLRFFDFSVKNSKFFSATQFKYLT